MCATANTNYAYRAVIFSDGDGDGTPTTVATTRAASSGDAFLRFMAMRDNAMASAATSDDRQEAWAAWAEQQHPVQWDWDLNEGDPV